jgi:DNA polymerase delta subunit 3
MASSYRQHLAEQVIAEQQIVSYRTVARDLKVHVNSAKRMLYDFHAHENAKRPGSVHATYLLVGLKRTGDKTLSQNGTEYQDEPVPSSPPPFTSSMLQPSQPNGNDADLALPPVRTITLVREEALDG